MKNLQRLKLAAPHEELQTLADRLMELRHALDSKKELGGDYLLARTLEDRIGGGRQLSGDVVLAEKLLAKHGF